MNKRRSPRSSESVSVRFKRPNWTH